jgi:hypothetical protein
MNESTCYCISGERAGRQGSSTLSKRGKKIWQGTGQTGLHSKACFPNCIRETNTSGSRAAVNFLWIRLVVTLDPSMNGCKSIIFAFYCKVCYSSPSTLSDPLILLEQFKQESLFQFGLIYAKTPDLDPAWGHRPCSSPLSNYCSLSF